MKNVKNSFPLSNYSQLKKKLSSFVFRLSSFYYLCPHYDE